MAKQYVLTTTPVKLDETKGIIYNKSRDTIELYSSDTAEIGTGLPVLSGQRQPFSGTVYARAIDGEGTEAVINVVDFDYYFVDAATASTVTLPSGVTELMTVSEVDALFA